MVAPALSPLAQLGRRLGTVGMLGSNLLNSARWLLPGAAKDKQL